ncbi:testis-expressed protein 2-like [Lampris incognitus]|uniref:testis-expressed protein 2-like n=1 Tax=Lampris incognitus TaxID=2546036 RepID=UPI0024B5962D|nr:testis-expressed protein 2-like [Lampris incognitus]
MEESKLIFSLDGHDKGPTVAFSKEKTRSDPSLGMDLGLELSQGHRSPAFFLPHSPSSPSSLADLSATSADLLVTTHLVKSSSTELEPRENSSPRPKPLLSLVKSLSTEISHRGEPEDNLSKSDSKLHMHPWKQLNQPKIAEARPEAGGSDMDNAWISPPTPGSLSPTETRGSSLIAELEDTRRKFSEAMHDPLSMLSKIMGDESSGSPKQWKASGAGDSPASFGSCGTPVHGEDRGADTHLKCRRRTDVEHRAVCGVPQKRPRKDLPKPSLSPEGHSRDSHYEICTYGDFLQVVEVAGGPRRTRHSVYTQPQGRIPRASVPLHWLFCVGLLAYGFFVLPLPSYVTGLSVGLACGFMLGLLVVFMFAPRRSASRNNQGSCSYQPMDARELKGANVLEGWMNEMYSYDPETFQPSLTHSVHAALEGSLLRLSYPRANIPRWVAFDETPHEAVFVRSCTYQLANSKVSLLPPVLARKRVWNKKYPICVILSEGEKGEESVIEGQEEGERTERQIVRDPQVPVTLYLFGRTGREKEEWFQHFLSASKSGPDTCPSREEPKTETLSSGEVVKGSTEELRDLPGAIKAKTLLDYSSYMTQLVGSESGSPTTSPCHGDQESPTVRKMTSGDDCGSGVRVEAEPGVSSGTAAHMENELAWVNSLVGRIFWDFLREKYWSDQVAHKIQKKLTKIRLPYFMNELTLADLDMGTCLPQVLSTSKPSLDRRGLWLELEVVYTGCLQMTLETKMNLCKLGKEGGAEAHSVPETRQVGSKPRLSILADSDEESSSAGSSDEEEVPPGEPQGSPGDKNTPVAPSDGHAGGSTSRKILRIVDKIAKSKYFQKATENEYIKKKIAEVSNMPLMLTVEVLELSGTLAINIPPPPTDRIWYSFRVPPRLDLRVRPMLGEREVTFSHVTEWIERKLQSEFQEVFVMPNMDDLYLPLMTSGLDNPPPSHHSPARSSSRQSSMESQEYLSE